MQDGIRIIHEPTTDEPFLVLDKDAGLPSAPIKNSTDSALTRALKIFPELSTVCGKKAEEYGLVHRIDTATSGLLLIAANQDFYDWISICQRDGKFVKHYTAICEHLILEDNSFPTLPCSQNDLLSGGWVKIVSQFRYYGTGNKIVRPVCKWSSPVALKKAEKNEYSTELRFRKRDGESYKFEARITRGFKHQVRCHLCWCGYPVVGDSDYNPHSDGEMHFFADGFHFSMPDGRKIEFSLEIR